MRLSGPPPVRIQGRNALIRGPLGIAVNIDTGGVTGPGKALAPLASPAPTRRA